MKNKRQLILLGGLLLVLAFVVLSNWGDSSSIPGISTAPGNYQPLAVDNPELRLDLLEKIRKQEYAGSHINIFTGKPIRPPAPLVPVVQSEKPLEPPRPPQLTVPVKFFGYTSDPGGGRKRAFFTNGDDVFILAEGETLLSRFRLLRIGNTTAELEEISTGRRATLTMDLPPEV
jgi:hypothetical protein